MEAKRPKLKKLSITPNDCKNLAITPSDYEKFSLQSVCLYWSSQSLKVNVKIRQLPQANAKIVNFSQIRKNFYFFPFFQN